MQALRADTEDQSWAPAICSSPLHSAGLSMDNPFEMFDEVGRSLKWFNLSRNVPDCTDQRQEQALVEDDASKESYDSDSSSTASWNRNSFSKDEEQDDDIERQDGAFTEKHLKDGAETVTDQHHENASHKPKIEEIFDDTSTWSNEYSEDRWDRANIASEVSLHESTKSLEGGAKMLEPPWKRVAQLKNRNLYSQNVPMANGTSGDPVSGLVRSFFGTSQRKSDIAKPAPEETINDVLALEKKIKALEIENSKFRRENQRINNILKGKEDDAARFAQDKAAWERQKASDMQAFYTEKEQLLQELRREKRMLEKQSQCMLQLPNPLPSKAERREIADLKAKLIDVHEEHLKKEARLRLTNIRLRKLVKELSGRVNEKQDEIKRYERLLTDWNAQEHEKPIKSRASRSFLPEEVPVKEKHGSKTPKSVECSLNNSGCRVTGALFHQRHDSHRKQEKEVTNREGLTTASEIRTGTRRNSVVYEKWSASQQNPTATCVQIPSDAVITIDEAMRLNDRKVRSTVEEIKDSVILDVKMKTVASDRCKQNVIIGCGAEKASEPDITSTFHGRVSANQECVAELFCENGAESPVRTKQRSPDETSVRGSQRRSMIFTDGTREEEYQDGLACVYFPNGDIKNSLTDGTTEYYYSEIDTWHTTKPNGVEIFYFPHNQIEEHWPNGQKRIIFPDGTTDIIGYQDL